MSFFAQEDRFVKVKSDGIKRRIYMPKSELSSRGTPKIIDDWNIDSSQKLGRPMPEILTNPATNLSMIRAHKDPPAPDIYNPNLDTVRPSANHGSKWESNKSPRFRYPTPEPKEEYVPAPPPSRTPSSFNKRLMALSDSSAKGLLRLDFFRSTSPGASNISPGRSCTSTSPTHALGQGLGPGLSFGHNASIDLTDCSTGHSGCVGHLDSFSMLSVDSFGAMSELDNSSIIGKSAHGNVRFAAPVPRRSRHRGKPTPPASVPRCHKSDVREAMKLLRGVLKKPTEEQPQPETNAEPQSEEPAATGEPIAVAATGHVTARTPAAATAAVTITAAVDVSAAATVTAAVTTVAVAATGSPVAETAETRQAKREVARRRHHSAARIQALQRGKAARRSVLMRFQEKELRTEQMCHHKAATQVQRLFRGSSGRRASLARFRARDEDRERSLHEKAATRVQSAVRGTLARRLSMKRRLQRDRLALDSLEAEDAFDSIFISPDGSPVKGATAAAAAAAGGSLLVVPEGRDEGEGGDNSEHQLHGQQHTVLTSVLEA